jgi:ribose transport system substrate-binding protein
VLQRTPDLSGVFGTNLFSAEGAACGVKNASLAGVVKVANFDAPEQAIADLRADAVDLVIAQQSFEMGSTGVDLRRRSSQRRYHRSPEACFKQVCAHHS